MTNTKGLSVKDVSPHDFVRSFSAFLKKSGKLHVPDWSDIIKTGIYKELAPVDQDWFYVRSASVARHLYCRSPSGVGAFTKVYGGKKRNGSAPPKFCRGSASVARKVLQALEQAGYVKKHPNGGRTLTSMAHRDMDRLAQQVRKQSIDRAAAAAAAAAAVVIAPIIEREEAVGKKEEKGKQEKGKKK